jgi:RNA polymerase sigma-70 factor (ECF subfamily)
MRSADAPSTAAPARSRELDEVTLRRAQRGDEDACRALVRCYERPVFALLSRLLGAGRAPLVEDLAQETFLQVFRALDGFSPIGPARLSTWILTIASRRAIDELRRRPPPLVPLDDSSSLAAADRTDRPAQDRQLAAALERALTALGPDHRAAFLLREYHGMEYADIARALEIDIGTVKSRLARAREALRTLLAEVHHG